MVKKVGYRYKLIVSSSANLMDAKRFKSWFNQCPLNNRYQLIIRCGAVYLERNTRPNQAHIELVKEVWKAITISVL